MITQDVTPITPLPSFLAPERPAAVDNLVEVELPLLTEELPEVINQINSTATNINNKETSVTDKYNSISPYFDEIDLVVTAIQSGDLPTIIDDTNTSALTTWSSEKIDSEIDIHTKTEKTLLVDTDEIMIADTNSSWSFKKLSWANLKSNLKKYFDTLYMALTGNQTIAGNKNFTGNVLMTGSSSVIGYGDGSGGTVTQLTSKSTVVTLNKPTGQITMNNSALAAGASVEFTLNNTFILTYSIVTVNPVWNNSNYKTEIVLNTTGAVIIKVTNMSGNSLSNSLAVRFNVISGAVS